MAVDQIFMALGDIHGQLDRSAAMLTQAAVRVGAPAFVLQVGDLEAHRSTDDMFSMYAPHHHKRLGDFSGYSSAEKTFPFPLYFIGGNHEPYQFLFDSAGTHKIAANITFLGRAGVITLNGLRVAFLTGIFDEKYYPQSPNSRPPVAHDHDYPAQRFLSCFTRIEAESLLDNGTPDILLVHEWPFGIVRPEDHEPQEPAHRHMRHGETGVHVLRDLVDHLQPAVVLCGHMHRHYRATIRHKGGNTTHVYCLGLVDHSTTGIACFASDNGSVVEVPL